MMFLFKNIFLNDNYDKIISMFGFYSGMGGIVSL